MEKTAAVLKEEGKSCTTIARFLKSKGFTPDRIAQVLKNIGYIVTLKKTRSVEYYTVSE